MFKFGIVFALLVTGCSAGTGNSKDLDALSHSIVEDFITTFYSFDTGRLSKVLVKADKSLPLIVYYQGWARGGHYKVVERMPCRRQSDNKFSCSITVEDDHMKALNIAFNVTDTFTITLNKNAIISVGISSNDLQVYQDAAKWVKAELPDLIEKPWHGKTVDYRVVLAAAFYSQLLK